MKTKKKVMIMTNLEVKISVTDIEPMKKLVEYSWKLVNGKSASAFAHCKSKMKEALNEMGINDETCIVPRDDHEE